MGYNMKMDNIELRSMATTRATLEKAYDTQFNTELPIELQRTSCGIAALSSALKSLRIIPFEVPFPDFVASFISGANYTYPTIGKLWKYKGKELYIPVKFEKSAVAPNLLMKAHELVASLSGKETSVKRIDNNQLPWIPTFTLETGFDHRGLNGFFALRGIAAQARLVESPDFEVFINEARQFDRSPKPSAGEKYRVLMSVDQKKLGYPMMGLIGVHISTHIICVHDIAMVGDTPVALFTDPAVHDRNSAIMIRSLESLAFAYAGKFSIITNKTESNS
jgi:hypothetical protein